VPKMIREECIKNIFEEVEQAKIHNKTRAVYEGIKNITGKHAPMVKSVRDENGKILTDPMKVKERWKEYFDKLYNDPNEVDDNILNDIPESANKDTAPDIMESEVRAAIGRLKQRKANGVDNVSVGSLA
jgi:2-oxoglutarate dehydrogenase complex dehydrogenase (E1) component-like enzyme